MRYTVINSGGARLRRYTRSRPALIRWLEGLDLRVGFPDGYIMPLAISHEFGVRSVGAGDVIIPQRPAFRAARTAMSKAWLRQSRRIMREASKPSANRATLAAMVAVAVAEQRDILKDSYRNFHGEPLSERQRARKENTPGEGKQLTGHRGERLIDHIAGWVNGARV